MPAAASTLPYSFDIEVVLPPIAFGVSHVPNSVLPSLDFSSSVMTNGAKGTITFDGTGYVGCTGGLSTVIRACGTQGIVGSPRDRGPYPMGTYPEADENGFSVCYGEGLADFISRFDTDSGENLMESGDVFSTIGGQDDFTDRGYGIS